MTGRPVAAICSGCGADMIFTTRRRRQFKQEHLRCPSCISRTTSSPAEDEAPNARVIAQTVLLDAYRIQRVLDPDEPDTNEERVASLRAVVDDLYELSVRLVPRSPDDPPPSR